MTLGRIAFLRLCHEELSRVKERDGIGLYAEKRLHSVLKRWILDDLSAHEQKVAERGGKQSRFVADVLTPEGRIFEIQTGKLYPLAKKMKFYIEQTDHPITLVRPLLAQKHTSWIDPESGELVKRHRSPKHETPLHALAQLRPFLDYLGNPRFTLLLPLIEADEYRLLDGWGKNKKRGSHRYELFPLDLVDTVTLATKEDLLALFPADLPEQFTAKIFSKHTRLRGYDLYNALAVFEALGAIAPCGKEGRARLYKRQ